MAEFVDVQRNEVYRGEQTLLLKRNDITVEKLSGVFKVHF